MGACGVGFAAGGHVVHRIGFVGLGVMGEPMAVNLLRAGFRLEVWDVRREPVNALAAQGATAVDGLGDLFGCDAVIVMVNTDAQAREVIGELISGTGERPGAILSMSTILPSTIRELGVGAGSAGIDLLDAPVSGGPIVAQLGGLAIMVGGDRARFDEARPAFEAMGGTIEVKRKADKGTTFRLTIPLREKQKQ